MLYQTARLYARRIGLSDLESMYAVYGNTVAMRWVGDGNGLDRAGCARWIDVTLQNYATRGYGMFAINLKPSGPAIGFCGLVHPDNQPEAEIKYAFLEEHWGKGFASETVRGMIKFGAEKLGLTEIIATTALENIASHRVLLKAGMCEAEVRDEVDGFRTKVFRWEAFRSG